MQITERILCFSDIHGQAARAREALARAAYNPDRDLLVFLGDAIDRGPESREAVQLLRGLERQGAVVLRGNHEQMLHDYMQNPQEATYYLHRNNGGLATLLSYGCWPGKFSRELARDCEWLNSRPVFFLHEDACLFFVHAGLDPGRPLQDQRLQDLLWVSKEWVFSERPHPWPFVVVFGHSITLSWVPEYLAKIGQSGRLQEWTALSKKLGVPSPVFRETDRICVDTGAASGLPGTVTVYDLTNDIHYVA